MRKSSFDKDTDIREYRRKLIVRLSDGIGLKQQVIAKVLDCTQGYVSEVLKAHRQNGEDALKSVSHPGAESELSPTDLEGLKKVLAQGAKARGYDDDL